MAERRSSNVSFSALTLKPTAETKIYLTSPPTVRAFKRAHVPDVSTQTDGNFDGSSEEPIPYNCLVCGQNHRVGYCPLKLAGVEYCGLCGLAHYGHQRTCPHLNSELQVATMLGTLKQSSESPLLVEEATKYLRGIRGDLVRRKKMKGEREEKDHPGVGVNGHGVNGAGNAYNFPRFPIPDFSVAGVPERPKMGDRRRSN